MSGLSSSNEQSLKKTCLDCGETKSLDAFSASPRGVHSRNSYCKVCMRELSKKNRAKKPDYYKKYRDEHREDSINYSKEYRRRNRKKINDDRQKKAAEKNLSEDTKQKAKEKRQTEAYKKKKSEYYKKKYHGSEQFRLKKKFEAKLNYLLDKDDVIDSVALIGCTVPEYKQFLEDRFIGHMKWSTYATVWEIARVVPFKNWDLTKEEEASICYHYTNSTPMFLVTTIVDDVMFIGSRNRNKL